MWATIQAGHPWSGLVKNRRADGRYYWVKANVTPLVENGKPTGYMSVRTKPEQEEVRAAESLYQTMQAEAADGRLIHRLHSGNIRSSSFSGRIRSALYLDLSGELTMVSMAIGVTGFLLGAWMTGHIGDVSAWLWAPHWQRGSPQDVSSGRCSTTSPSSRCVSC